MRSAIRLFFAAIWFAMLVLGIVTMAHAQTTVSDRIYSPLNGSLFEGRLVVTAPDMTYAGRTYVRGSREYVVSGGNFNASLIPNDAATPAGTAYTVRYIPASGSSWTEYWTVPTSASPVKINAIRAAVAPSPSTSISWSQITGAPTFSGGLSYTKAFTAATVVSVPLSEHGFDNANLLVTCRDLGGAPVEPGDVVVNTSTFAVTINFAVAQSGTCEIGGASTSFSLAVTALTTVSIPASTHLLRTITGAACFGVSSQVVQTGAVTFTPVVLDIGGAMSTSFDVSIAFATPHTGRCALLGV